MANDWIKIRKDLPTDPNVYKIAELLDVSRNETVGLLVLFWSWADTHLMEGHAPSVTGVTVDDVVRHDGFANALIKFGWLTVNGNGISIPNFDRHMSENAKKRALDSERQRKSRLKRNAASVTDVTETRDKSVTREEKKREEKNSLSKDRESKAADAAVTIPHKELLDDLLDVWAASPWVQKVRDRRGRGILDHWRSAVASKKTGKEFLEVVRDVDAITKALQEAQGGFLETDFSGFVFTWLLESKKGIPNIVKLAEGRYRKGRGRSPTTTDCGPGKVYDPHNKNPMAGIL